MYLSKFIFCSFLLFVRRSCVTPKWMDLKFAFPQLITTKILKTLAYVFTFLRLSILCGRQSSPPCGKWIFTSNFVAGAQVYIQFDNVHRDTNKLGPLHHAILLWHNDIFRYKASELETKYKIEFTINSVVMRLRYCRGTVLI